MKIIGVTENETSNRENWRRRIQNLSAAATPQQSGTSWKKKKIDIDTKL